LINYLIYNVFLGEKNLINKTMSEFGDKKKKM